MSATNLTENPWFSEENQEYRAKMAQVNALVRSVTTEICLGTYGLKGDKLRSLTANHKQFLHDKMLRDLRGEVERLTAAGSAHV